MSLSYTVSPFHPTNPYPNQVTTELDLANQNFTTLAQAFVNADPTTLTVVNSASVGGYGVSATPHPNTLLPLNSNAVFYNALSTTTLSNSYSVSLGNNLTYNITAFSVSTPSQPIANNYKVVVRLTAIGNSSSSGYNNFRFSVATASQTQYLTYWFWWTPASTQLGFTDVVIYDQAPNTTNSYTIQCYQGGDNSTFVLDWLVIQYAVFPG